MQEEFEKWANGFSHDSRDWLDMGNDKVFFAGWQARQAEIDALKAKLKLAEASERKAAENNIKLINEHIRLKRLWQPLEN